MKVCRLKIVAASLVMLVIGAGATVPAYADEANECHCVETMIIGGGKFCDDGTGDGTFTILNIGLTVLTFGVGIAATGGLIWAGIKYATSGTNVEQATKARRRIFEIALGLVAYAVLYTGLQWLVPGGTGFSSGTEITAANCATKTPAYQQSSSSTTDWHTSNEAHKYDAGSYTYLASSASVQKLLDTVKQHTWPSYKAADKMVWKDGNSERQLNRGGGKKYGTGVYWAKQGEADCGVYVTAMVRKSGYDKDFPHGSWAGLKCDRGDACTPAWRAYDYMRKSSKWKDVTSEVKAEISKGGNGNKAMQQGDVIVSIGSSNNHIMLWIGKVPGFAGPIAEASYSGGFTGRAGRPGHGKMKNIFNGYGSDRVHVYRLAATS